MANLIKAVMAAVEAEKEAKPNALQTHLTAANNHLAAAVEEKQKTEEASAEEVEKVIANWY